MNITLAICILLLLIEEYIHQYYRRAGLLNNIGNIDPETDSRERTATRRLKRVRWLQLIAFGILFLSAGDKTGSGFAVCASGQVTAVIMAMQIIRVIGRKIINRWLILGILQLQQIILLVLLPFMKSLDSIGGEKPIHTVSLWLAGVSGVIAAVFLGIAFSFCVAYFLRLWSREKSMHFDEYPPLVYSESWTRKLTLAALLPTCISFTALCLLSISRYYPEPALVPASLAMICLTAAMHIFRRSGEFHHPSANLLVTASVLIVFTASILGYTTLAGS